MRAGVREALANCARHAGAHAVVVQLAITGDELLLSVDDDGRGVSGSTRRSGLANLDERARRFGGGFRVVSPTTPEGRGTRLEWWVPLRARG